MQATLKDETLRAHLRLHGRHALAYGTLQGLNYFNIEETGYLAFATRGKVYQTVHVLGDPICATKDFVNILDDFIELYPGAAFWQIGESAAHILSERGFFVNDFGVVTSLPIRDYTLEGKKKQNIRTALNRNLREHVRVEEVSITNLSKSDTQDISSISKSWMNGKTVSDGEMRFLVRPDVMENESEVRIFVARKAKQMIAYCKFDPLFENDKIIGYAANIIRARKGATPGVRDNIVISAMNKFREEGKDKLSLGLSPFHNIEDSNPVFKPSKFVHHLFSFSYQYLNSLYNFRGLASHKNQYHGNERRVYFASRSRIPIRTMVDACIVSNFHPKRQVYEALVRSIQHCCNFQ